MYSPHYNPSTKISISFFTRYILFVLIVSKLFLSCKQEQSIEDFKSQWATSGKQTWIGPEYWANRLQDWQLRNDRLECLVTDTSLPMRTVHLLTRRLTDTLGTLEMSVITGINQKEGDNVMDAATGFLIGAGPTLDYRAAALVHHSAGEGAGLFAGISGNGKLFIKDFNDNNTIKIQESTLALPEATKLSIRITHSGNNYSISLTASDVMSDNQFGSIEIKNINKDHLTGNLALVSHPGKTGNPASYWFKNWQVSGTKVAINPNRVAGPVIATQYTLSGNLLKMTAQMMPVGDFQSKEAILEIKKENSWRQVATAVIDTPSYTATFRIENWKYMEDIAYRVSYTYITGENMSKDHYYKGMIKQNPVNKQTIVIAGFTGNHQLASPGVDAGYYNWTFDNVWFPHADLTKKVKYHQPDVLFFSGDQIYETASPTRTDMENIYLDYLYRWYLWCWEFQDLTRETPCISIPDDHDVYQGNLWGEGGKPTMKDDKGGYVYPAHFVKMVEKTQTSHLPDPYDPTPVKQNIGVYYTSMVYGGISFAILEDRKFKSGPNGKVPPTKSNRADHVIDPGFNSSTADLPGLKLLGDRQLEFLDNWAQNWDNARMKIVLSQTVFGNMATHHGGDLNFLVADYDANGWPQTGRNKALDAIRKGFGFMYCGDQHLSTIVHHGIDTWGDAGWSFCVPSIANFYPRAWMPKEAPREKFETTQEYCGKYKDGFGNHVSVWAHTNPYETGKEPANLHDRMPGYGIVKMDKSKQTITMECWPRYADPATDKQYEGWPKTIHMLDNYGREAKAWLPTLQISGLKTPPVIQVINESTGKIEYTSRAGEFSFSPKVFSPGLYTITITDTKTNKKKSLENVQSLDEKDLEQLEVQF